MGGAVSPLPNTPSWHGAQLGGVQGQLFPSQLQPGGTQSGECVMLQ
jgi:hypothetical protein